MYLGNGGRWSICTVPKISQKIEFDLFIGDGDSKSYGMVYIKHCSEHACHADCQDGAKSCCSFN